MDLPAGKARDRFVVAGIRRSVLRYEALNSIAGVRAKEYYKKRESGSEAAVLIA
jgi:hypothetical protein